jgi:RNA polymerase sigma factor (sigma-70 family)
LPHFVRHLDDEREPKNVTVNGPESQTEEFERQRPHLHAVAYRMLGSLSDADDVVQEAWLRLHGSDGDSVENVRGWLTTVVARLCLDELRTRQARREDYVGSWLPEPVVTIESKDDPEQEALVADSIGLALLVVGETLGPAERLLFVLRERLVRRGEDAAYGLGAVRQLTKVFGWFRERITAYRPPHEFDYLVERSLPRCVTKAAGSRSLSSPAAPASIGPRPPNCACRLPRRGPPACSAGPSSSTRSARPRRGGRRAGPRDPQPRIRRLLLGPSVPASPVAAHRAQVGERAEHARDRRPRKSRLARHGRDGRTGQPREALEHPKRTPYRLVAPGAGLGTRLVGQDTGL